MLFRLSEVGSVVDVGIAIESRQLNTTCWITRCWITRKLYVYSVSASCDVDPNKSFLFGLCKCIGPPIRWSNTQLKFIFTMTNITVVQGAANHTPPFGNALLFYVIILLLLNSDKTVGLPTVFIFTTKVAAVLLSNVCALTLSY